MPQTEYLKSLKGQLQEVIDESSRVTNTFRDEGGGRYVVSLEQKAELDRLRRKGTEIKDLIESQVEIEGFSEAIETSGVEGMDSKSMRQAAGGGGEIEPYSGSPGSQFIESAEFKAWAGNGTSAEFEVKDVFTTMTAPTTTLGFGHTQRDTMIPLQHRTGRVRDLFNAQKTTANLIEYYKVTGLVNAAAGVPERDTTPNPDVFALKPQSTLNFAPSQAPVRTVAHWEAAHRNVLDDEPQLRGIIDNELLYGLRLVEDAQILSGSGAGENLLGILNTPGIQTQDRGVSADGTNRADAVRKAITKVMLANYEATGVVLHPNDWERIELAKDNEARYLITVGVAVGAEQRLWRLPVVDTPAIADGTALVGAFGLGAQLYDRAAATIRMAEQHADFFLRNAIVVLAEQRLAMAVKRPESFVKVNLANPT